MKVIAAGLLLMACSACSLPYRGPLVVQSPTGTNLCGKHKDPIVRTVGYRPPAGMHFAVREEYSEILARYPNQVPLYLSLDSFGAGSVKTAVTYCPECELGAKAAWRKVDSQIRRAWWWSSL